MNNQLRVFIVFLGGLLVALTFTFPIWQSYLVLLPGGGGVIFTCLPPQYNEAFLTIPETSRDALVTLADEQENLACEITLAYLRQDNPVPEAQQELPDMLGQTTIVLGDFVSPLPAIEIDGQLTIFELADGRKLARINTLDTPNISDVTVWLSASSNPQTREELEQGNIHIALGELQGNVGNQNYEIAAQVDLSLYNSIVLYSERLDTIVGYARFTSRF